MATISSFTENDNGIYRLFVSKGTCISDDSLEVVAGDCLSPFIPNVFTPNNDGRNDYFELYNFNIEKINCKIFNRWGNLIYEWNDPDGKWNGTDQSGKKVSDGVYYYMIEVKAVNKENQIFKGSVQVVRD